MVVAVVASCWLLVAGFWSLVAGAVDKYARVALLQAWLGHPKTGQTRYTTSRRPARAGNDQFEWAK